MTLTPFTFPATGHQLRTVWTDDDTPWFVGRDVALALGYTNPGKAVRDHVPAGHRRGSDSFTPSDLGGLDPQTVLISEAGLYRLIMRSNTVIAERFQEWVTNEVLPTIRQTGGYQVTPPPQLPDLTTPAGVLALAEQLTQTARQLVEADAKVQEMEPKAIAHDTYLSAGKGDRLVREVAKLLGWKESNLRQFLLAERVIFHRQALCGVNQYDVYADFTHHFRPVEKVVHHTWGPCSHYTLYVRPSGVDFIQMRVRKQRDRIRAEVVGTQDSLLDMPEGVTR